MAASRALDLAQASVARHQARPLVHVALTKAQAAFDEIDAPEAAWVDGNAVGKSFELAYLVHRFVRGEHPTMKRRSAGAARVLVMGTSYEQMVPLMEKLWLLACKAELDPRCGFDEGRGITGKPPRLVFTSGPAAGAVIVFATYRSGARRVAGGQYDLVVMDEPSDEEVFGEVRPRIMRRRGFIRLGFTPVPDMPDQSWIRRRFERGTMVKHTVGMRQENMHPAGFPVPWFWQAEIDAYAANLLDHERAMRIDGSLEPVVRGRWLKAFDASKHVRNVALKDLAGWSLIVGLDHGTADGKQCAVLVAVAGGGTSRPKVVFLDECVAEGFTAPEQDAAAILDMLRRNGLMYDSVDEWVGDVPTESRRQNVRKSNEEIRKELAAQLGRPLRSIRPFTVPTKGSNSPSAGCRDINTLFHRDDARVRPCCVRLIASINVFAGDPHDPVKDVLDAGRYAFERGITAPVGPILQARY